MNILQIGRAAATASFVGLVIALTLSPAPAIAQCIGASAVENFAANMKGCAATVGFASRASMCATGWHVCSAAEWVDRSAGQIPKYNYWTNDHIGATPVREGCFVTVNGGAADCGETPMHVCTIAKGELDGAWQSDARFYLIQSFLPDGSISVVTSVDRTSLQSQTFAGVFDAGHFAGSGVGVLGSLTLTFTSETTGTDGSLPFTKVADQTIATTSTLDFNFVSDPLGNGCNWHSCGLDTPYPNRYFGGCADNNTAGVLCCQ
jgi:hypothetical protein